MYKKALSLMLVFVMILSMQTFVFAEDSVEITIVHTNDTHSRVYEGKYDGMGFAKISTKVKQLRAENPNLLLLDAGDSFHGNPLSILVEGETIVDLMNAMGYDAMTPGNHDFNYGYERLLELDGMTEFPILAANVKMADDSRILAPYVIKEIEGVKIGIFGIASPETVYKTNPINVEGLTFTSPIEEAKAMVAELEGQVDVIIALTHVGLDEETKETSEMIAAQVDGIDLIVDGHSHTSLPEGKLVGDTLIVQTGEYDKNLGIVKMTVTGDEVALSASLLTKEEAADLEEDADLLKVIEDVEKKLEPVTSAKAGTSAIVLDGEREQVRTGETNLGNLLTDAMIAETGADIAFTNGGGIRASIDQGDITVGELVDVLPFGNYIVTVDMKGADIVAAIENGIDAYPGAKGAFPHVSGMSFTFDPNMPAGERVVKVMVGDSMIDENKVYTVATNNFLANGGDGYDMIGKYELSGEYSALIEAVEDYIAKNGTAGAKVEGRVVALPVKADVEYTVVAGDVLWKIAQAHGTTWEALAEYNNLANPHLIMPGDVLKVPAK